ncbi:uncharacterized protein LOC142332328 [Lycorma delicatula]|uniref:uncharacterized protein LOC142318304 n=1 Tax=Lycorma delicatula TaxID=130591 RepID=UPI003F515EBE
MFVPFAALSKRINTLPFRIIKECGLNRFDNDGIVSCKECNWTITSETNLFHCGIAHKTYDETCSVAEELFNCCLFFKDSIVCIDLMMSTFSNWPRLFPKVELLLEAGFYFTGVMDSVACIECGLEIFEWLDNDNPFKEHQKVSYNCKMVKNKMKG